MPPEQGMNYLQKLSRADIQSFSRGLGFANPLVDKPTMLSQLTKQLLSLRISGAPATPRMSDMFNALWCPCAWRPSRVALYGNRRLGLW